MKKFYYRSKLKMEPRFNNKFSTVYYKQDTKQKVLLKCYVLGVRDIIQDSIEENNNLSEWMEPLQEFRRTGKQSNYSAYQIINDLVIQLEANKDSTESMISRWNKVFTDTQYQIMLIKE